MITLNPAKFKCDIWTDNSKDKESKPVSQTSTDVSVTLNNMSIHSNNEFNNNTSNNTQFYNNNPNY